MKTSIDKNKLKELSSNLDGELFFDNLHKVIYATDASVYRKIPLAVAYPKNKNDIKKLIAFATKNKTTLVPRTAGTSLSGQCVGDGIIVDVSKYFTKILDFDKKNKTITLEPGVVRDELNIFLKPHGYFFSPNTSTSNRCMIGGMVGNNSCGTTSVQYGVTRDKIIELKTILSDGSESTFKSLEKQQFFDKQKGDSLENKIYKIIYDKLSKKQIQDEITKQFPKKSIKRRNTGYAVDNLLDTEIFSDSTNKINIAKLLCGSEGTLAFTTEITIKLDKLPPKEKIVIAVHFKSIKESLEAVIIAMKHKLYMCELMDKAILDCTKNNREQLKNRFFIQGDPEAILLLEVKSDTEQNAELLADNLINDLKNNGFGYAFPKLYKNDTQKATTLRSAGLGLLGNIVGDKKAVACIEDTAVSIEDLPSYIKEFTEIMDSHNQKAIYYAHAGDGEIHLRPILNLKKSSGVNLFKIITEKTAKLVKKYKGSFSGEHGDGIVRGEFLPLMIGEKNYNLLREIKLTFDPNNIFNKGKIIDAFPMDKSLRYITDREEPVIETIQDFSDSKGILRAVEKCNGSGDCRKTSSFGGTMCPSYRASLDEKDTTRARANALREFLTNPENKNPFDRKELKKVFDLCLSCKACAIECPSGIDMASFKAEFLYQYQKDNPPSIRTKLFANSSNINKLTSLFPNITNAILNTKLTKKMMGIATERTIPKLAKITLRKWFESQKRNLEINQKNSKTVYLFCDEFTNYYDTQIGIDTIELLQELGYTVKIPKHQESGRSFISKGFLDKAKQISDKNIKIFKDKITDKTPLIGIEPSAILSFRDEYIRLANDNKSAEKIAKNTFTIEEFIQQEFEKNNIKSSQFSSKSKTIKIHGHCHQKSLSSINSIFTMLNIPKNYTVTIINSGCCGMAGSFGYEREHYSFSMKVGEQSLFSKIRNYDSKTEISASGTSCRHQIFDGTKKMAKHPVTLLKEALL